MCEDCGRTAPALKGPAVASEPRATGPQGWWLCSWEDTGAAWPPLAARLSVDKERGGAAPGSASGVLPARPPTRSPRPAGLMLTVRPLAARSLLSCGRGSWGAASISHSVSRGLSRPCAVTERRTCCLHTSLGLTVIDGKRAALNFPGSAGDFLPPAGRSGGLRGRAVAFCFKGCLAGL